MSEKKSIFDKITAFVLNVIVPPMAKFADLKTMKIIRNGLVGSMPVVLAGSVFLIVYILASGAAGGAVILPFLAPYAGKIVLVNSLTIGMMALYSTAMMGIEFAREYELDITSCVGISIVTYIALQFNEIIDGAIGTTGFSAQGLFVAMIAVFLGCHIYRFCIVRNLIIKMPADVPPQIGASFAAVIPYFIAIFIAWFIRTILDINLVTIIAEMLKPVLGAADSLPAFTLFNFLIALFWAVGIHGDNMLGGIISPLTAIWLEKNIAAMEAGTALTKLPHIWIGTLSRLTFWTASVWGLLFWLALSKRKSNRDLFKLCLPSAIFTIVEPVMFGLPIVLNPVLLIPFVFSATFSSAVGYIIMQMGFINRFFISVPWATPPFINAWLANGNDFKALIIVVISFLIGVICYAPFIKALEKQQEEEAKALNA